MLVWDWTVFIDKEKKDEEEGKQFYYKLYYYYNFSWDAIERKSITLWLKRVVEVVISTLAEEKVVLKGAHKNWKTWVVNIVVFVGLEHGSGGKKQLTPSSNTMTMFLLLKMMTMLMMMKQVSQVEVKKRRQIWDMYDFKISIILIIRSWFHITVWWSFSSRDDPVL